MLVLGDILRRQAHVRGDKTAYVVGAARMTYRAFHLRSNQLAHALARLGVRRGDRVAVLAGNRVEYPIVYFGVLKLGAIVVPVNARFTAAEVAHVVNHAEAETFVVAGEFEPMMAALRAEGRLSLVRHVIGLDGDRPGLDALADAETTDDVGAAVDEQDPHVML
jgi:acyl-CoA synthetase (AMP-forming)/AMP-acid ligase II